LKSFQKTKNFSLHSDYQKNRERGEKMKKIRNVFLACAMSLGVGMLAPQLSFAIPSMGVAPTNGGEYSGTSGGAYMDYFTTSYVPGSDGWAFDGDVTVWFGTQGSTPASTTAQIYLVTNSLSGAGASLDGVDFTFFASPDQADGYHRVNVGGVDGYYAVALGTILDHGWAPADAGSPFDGNNKDFYFRDGTVSGLSLDSDLDEWLFAVADMDADGLWFEDTTDDFSPKTTSSHGVPEPTAMLLFGTCLAGLAFVGKARKVK